MDSINQPLAGRLAQVVNAHWARLAPALPSPEVLHLHHAESTNTLLKEMARAGRLCGPAVLLADRQTAGRGTRGREWLQSPIDHHHALLPRDIALSVALNLSQGVDSTEAELPDPRLSLAAGAVAALALEAGLRAEVEHQGLACDAGLRLGLKWPNDLLVPDGAGWRKAGGMLLETVVATDERWLVAGVGVNVNSLSADFPSYLAPPAGTLRGWLAELLGQDAGGVELDVLGLAGALGAELGAALIMLGQDVAAPVRDEAFRVWTGCWLRRDATPGVRYQLTREGRSRAVTAQRVDPISGGLIVADDAGQEFLVTSYSELEPG